MQKLFVTYRTGYCGMDGHEVVEFHDEDDEDTICDELYNNAVQHASSYGIDMCSEDCDDEDCEMEHPGSSNIEFSYELYDPAKHDGKL